MATEEKGLRCPNCWCRHNRVTHTTYHPITWNGVEIVYIKRRRVCERCDTPFTTSETVNELPPEKSEERKPVEPFNPFLPPKAPPKQN